MKNILIHLLLCSLCTVANGQISQKIINDEFSNLPFGYTILPSNIKQKINCEFSIERKPMPNTHTNEIDSTLEYRCKNSQFCFYSSGTAIFLQKAVIHDASISLEKGIRVGLAIKIFLDIFNIDASMNNLDYAVITDSEEYSKHIVYFKESKITRIEIDPGFD